MTDSDIVTKYTDGYSIPELAEEASKTRYYKPDIFIPKDNRIIEVKSQYIYNKAINQNETKFKATREHGFDFELIVYK